MKKENVLQLAIIIMGLLLGYAAVQYTISAAVGFITAIGTKSGDADALKMYAGYLLIVLLYGVVCWQLIIHSGRLADFIRDKSGYYSPLVLNSKPVDLLYILLVVTGIYSLLDKMPALIKALINSFTEKAAPGLGDMYAERSPFNWMHIILNVVLPLALLMFAKPIASYFAKDIGVTTTEISNNDTEEEHLLNEP